ncbi:MAG: formate dehydrogenase subunit delta [Alphaproteobacteria bacterium]|nr:formate dehydrogenase subunit delta [Alphaproteobacteria bacterium]MDE2630751.1 formate dehydrogenase subunit delta [Alphaproteobacteria bacterium]
MSPDKLVYMANQIGKFFAHQGEAKAAASIADHLVKFWDPRMRKAIIAHLDGGGCGLDPLVLRAVKSLREAATAPKPSPAS